MHYIVPPFRPDSFHCVLLGTRFERGRWLPLEYVQAALEALLTHARARGEPPGIRDAPTKDAAELFAQIEAMGGPNYDVAFDMANDKYIASHGALAKWDVGAFAGVAVAAADGAYTFAPTSGGTASEVKDLLKQDAQRLSSYGWHADGGAPEPRSYYTFAKAPTEVLSASEWSEMA